MREVSIPERTNLVNTHEMNPFFHKNYIDVVGTKICIRIRDTKKKEKKRLRTITVFNKYAVQSKKIHQILNIIFPIYYIKKDKNVCSTSKF